MRCIFEVLISGMCFGLLIIGVGVLVCACVCVAMCVLEIISVDVCVLRRMSVRGLSVGVCFKGIDY